MSAIRVAITDDHTLVVDGIEKALNQYPDIIVTGTYSNGKDLLAGLKTAQPDILLLDIQMPEMRGDTLAKTIHQRYPEIGIIALTGFDSPVYVRSMLHSGCKGYLLKSIDQKTLKTAIETVFKGEQYIEASIKEMMLGYALKMPTNKHPLVADLTKREKEVLALIVDEYTSAEIAQKLYLGQRTVEKYRLQLLQKLQVKNTAGLVKIALQIGLIEKEG